MSVFDNCQIALDLGINVGFKKKVELRKAITENGGVVSYIVTQKCSFVVASDPEKCDVSSKCRMALKYCLPVVSMDYIWDSLHSGKRLAIDQYAIAGKSKGLDFRSGKISALKKQVTKAMSRHTVKPHFNIRNVKVWQAGDPDEPHFDENFEIAKYAVFQGQNKKQDLIMFYSLEIHVGSNADKKENGNAEWQYRLYSHFGNLTDAVAGNPCKTEIHHVANADQALAGFATLYSAQMKDHKMQKVEGTMLRNVGSRKLQQILTVLESEVGVASREVQNLTEHIWLEAIGEVEAVLASPISSVKVEEVEKAEALLVKIRDALGNEGDGDVTSLVKEFYSTLPHKSENGGSVMPSRAWLSQKQDLCQLIRDMVSVSEATSWSARSSAQAKYRALRCNISYLEPGTQEHKQIMEDVVSSINKKMTINITNIYAVQRPIEDAHFQHEMDSKRHLFHSSKVENFLGILSRGLLLPKVVADDFGGTRTDAGMLGCGIYFASDASKSALYSTPSKTKGTRLLLVNEVALGRCYDYTAIDTTLTKPPEGYNSVHGVGKKNDNSSYFEDDEYVVYSVNQQRLRYLVEFTINQEQPRSMVTVENVLMETEDLVSMESCEIDLHDVQNVRDPMEGVKLGLVVENQEGLVELKSVHVRAKLVDLAAQVIVLQEYVNNSMYPVEAKYVFPLGDGAAVCGFEAFINDKHIVGEVKEKETAHREYKQAISEGHGAYLMDQDEETPDVFTVSVGNLPPHATVLIKITYVAELQVEEEIISFRLPGSVAPWKKESAGKEKTQDKTETFKLSSGQVSIQVAVEMPFDIKSLVCPTHSVRMKKTATKAVIELNPGQDIQEGFQILIGLAEIHVPRMWVERHPDQPDHEACMLTFYPEFEVGSEVSSELVLLLDVSNSMKGASLQSAKKIAKLILLAMDASWKFNVVVFGTRYTELFPCARPKYETTLEQAEKFIQQAQADMGNTEVFRPLHAYFLLPPANQALRNVFLISDGHLNNESSVLKDACNNYHHTRIFTFGVSSTCNAYSLRALARISAGSFEFFDTKVKSKWEEKVKGQLRKAGQPGLTSVHVEWRQYDDNLPPPVQAPCCITALFNGARQVIYGFVPNCTMAFLSAVVGGQEVSTVVSTSDLAITTGLIVHRLTARALIQDWETGMLSDDRTHHEVVRMDEKQNIIELSKEYSIVTQFTSFIAVEKRDKDEDMSKKGPSIIELVSKESIDILDYMGWQEEAMDIQEHQPLEQRDVTRLASCKSYVSSSALIQLHEDNMEIQSTDKEVPEDTFVDLLSYESADLEFYDECVGIDTLLKRSSEPFPVSRLSDISESRGELRHSSETALAFDESDDIYDDCASLDRREQTETAQHDSFSRTRRARRPSSRGRKSYLYSEDSSDRFLLKGHTLFDRKKAKRADGEDLASAPHFKASTEQSEALEVCNVGICQPAYSPRSPSYEAQSEFLQSYSSPGGIMQAQPAAQGQNLLFGATPLSVEHSTFQLPMDKSKEGFEPAAAQSVFLDDRRSQSRRAETSAGLFGSLASKSALTQMPALMGFSGAGFKGMGSSDSTGFGTTFGFGGGGRSEGFGAAFGSASQTDLAAEWRSCARFRLDSAVQKDDVQTPFLVRSERTKPSAALLEQATPPAAPFSQITSSAALFAQPTPSAAPFAQATPSAALFAQATPSAAPFAQITPSAALFAQPTPSAALFAQATPSAAPFAQTTPSAALFAQATPSAAPFAQTTPLAALFSQTTLSAVPFAQTTPSAASFSQTTPSAAPFAQTTSSVAPFASPLHQHHRLSASAATEVGGGKPEVLKNAPWLQAEYFSSISGASAERVPEKMAAHVHECLSFSKDFSGENERLTATAASQPQSSQRATSRASNRDLSLTPQLFYPQMISTRLAGKSAMEEMYQLLDTKEQPAPPPPPPPPPFASAQVITAPLMAGRRSVASPRTEKSKCSFISSDSLPLPPRELPKEHALSFSSLQQKRSLTQLSSPKTLSYVIPHGYFLGAEPDQERSESRKGRARRWDIFDEKAMSEAQGAPLRGERPVSRRKMIEKSPREMLDVAAGGPEILFIEEENDATVFGRKKKRGRMKKAFLEEDVTSRFEREIDFIQRQLEFQVGGKSGLLDYTADAKGQVPAIREAESNLTIDQWLQPDVLKTLLMLPDKEGEWSLDLQLGLVLHADIEACRQLLFSSGLRSFGESAASSLQKVVATLLVLISLLQVLLPELSPPDLVQLLKASISRFADSELQCKVRLALEGTKIELPNDLMSRLEKALCYCKVMDERHPLACSSLELASDWPTLCVNLLGLV